MSERISYEPGTPCWVDLGSPDLDASVEFYSALFGWQVPASENVEQTGGYRRATKDGADVAGMMPLMQEGQPPAWSSTSRSPMPRPPQRRLPRPAAA